MTHDEAKAVWEVRFRLAGHIPWVIDGEMWATSDDHEWVCCEHCDRMPCLTCDHPMPTCDRLGRSLLT